MPRNEPNPRLQVLERIFLRYIERARWRRRAAEADPERSPSPVQVTIVLVDEECLDEDPPSYDQAMSFPVPKYQRYGKSPIYTTATQSEEAFVSMPDPNLSALHAVIGGLFH